ncbi:MAG: MBL fold metallo-hydrolase [Omnitrophica WOR_2 bacterium]
MDKNTAKPLGEPARFRRLGAAGIEIKIRGKSLVVDPYFTRIPFWKIWTGGVTPNRAIIEQCLPQAGYILVTHSHFDHLMDVPVAIRHTEAVAFGSRNTCRILKIQAIPPDHRIEIHAGEHLDLGELQVDVLQAPVHSPPGFRPGPVPPDLKPPLKARDYSTDDFYSFLISVNNLRILHGVPLYPQKAARIDLWLPGMYLGAESREYAHWIGLIRSLRPKVIIPVHWDNFFRPLSRPEQPVLAPSGKILPPLRRWNISRMRSIIQKIDPQIKVLTLERMQENDLTELITMVN